MQLLLIEDDEVDKEIVYRLLKSKDYRIHHVSTGKEALQFIEINHPDCILLDYRLPDVDGLMLLPLLVDDFFPVIVLTGEDSPEVIVEAIQRGAQDYLVKGSLTTEMLTRSIKNAIDKSNLHKEINQKQQELAKQARVLAKRNQDVKALASALSLAEQRERRRISQILHDDVQQMLYGLAARIQILHIKSSPDAKEALKDLFTDIKDLIQQTIDITRILAVDLTPPVLKLGGISSGLEWLAQRMKQIHDLDVELKIKGDCHIENEDMRTLVLQLVQELLFNVVKHAQTKTAFLSMEDKNQHIVIKVQDDGVGFDISKKLTEQPHKIDGFGIYSIQERLNLFDGELEIMSEPGKGTTVTIILPKKFHDWALETV